MSDEAWKKFEEVVEDIKRKLEDAAKKVEEYVDKGDLHRAYRVWRDSVLNSLKALRTALDSLSESLKNSRLSEEELKRFAERVRGSVKDVVEMIEEIGDKIRGFGGRRVMVAWFWPKPFKHAFRDIFAGVEVTVDRVLDSVERLVESIEDSLEGIGRRATQVVSVRIREQDLDIIDRLVDVGIFRSRSEAVAYFTRKGIETSRDWIERALEQAKKIKELQESIRRELEQEEHKERRGGEEEK